MNEKAEFTKQKKKRKEKGVHETTAYNQEPTLQMAQMAPHKVRAFHSRAVSDVLGGPWQVLH